MTYDKKSNSIDKEAWKRLKTDRINRVGDYADRLDSASIEIFFDNDIFNSYACQLTALSSVNIIARWCSSINICIDEATPSLIHGEGIGFGHLLIETASNIDPYGHFTLNDPTSPASHKILISNKPEIHNGANDIFWISGSGWVAGCGYKTIREELTATDKNPIGPVFAACIGSAAVFSSVVAPAKTDAFAKYYSLYDFIGPTTTSMVLPNPEFNFNYEFGRIYQVGCGAVGSSLAYLLSLTNWSGEIHYIDFDSVKIENLCSSLLFDATSALNNSKKADYCFSKTTNERIMAIPFDGDYDEFLKSGMYSSSPPDIILCLANERNIWDTIQANCPPVVFHATTTINWGLNYGRHVPNHDWCLMCRFQSEINHSPDFKCWDGVIPSVETNTEEIIGVLPFLSPASAVLILAGIARLESFVIDSPNRTNFSFLPIETGTFSSLAIPPRKSCNYCKSIDLDIYPEEIRKSKYWYLTDNSG